MKYEHIVKGQFLERPNRFVARVRIEDREETVHVKNTGRCRELLQRDAVVYLEKCGGAKDRTGGRAAAGRVTAYDLVAVGKGDRLINMDSQAPNRAVGEWLRRGGFLSSLDLVRPEVRYGSSRFDFYIEGCGERIFMEVKGVTLEEDGVVRFPDAPSERAVKHLEELIAAKEEGYRACVLFVIQMEKVRYFAPNRDTHPQFADALCRAAEAGVEILAYDCKVAPDTMTINRPVPVRLQGTASAEQAFPADGINETLRKDLEKYKLDGISIPLLKWYDENRRILPWRTLPTPYRVWVSEIMLQQTRVEAVKPYFERFMEELPHIGALAEAEEEKLLKLWEGLGYYNRVRSLQKAARQVQEEYGGEMPDNYEALLGLAGIGSYTAGAIASIAFNQPVPAVDGNVMRVLSRLKRDERPVNDGKARAEAGAEIERVMSRDRPGDFNQAMMEIGACVCLPHGAPLCHKCPLKSFCQAHRAGKEQEYPKKQAKKPRQVEDRTVLVVRSGGCAAVRKRPDSGLLAGMYEIPSLDGFRTAEEVAAYLEDSGLKPLCIRPLQDAKHVFTHREWHMKGYLVKVEEHSCGPALGEAQEWLYLEPEETRSRYPIPSAFKAYVKYLRGFEEEEKS